jgi:hypothetical protein
MKQWEYRKIYLSDDNEWKELNKLGKQGWELVNAYMGAGTFGIIKREIQEHPTQEVKRGYSYEPSY